MKKKYLLLIVFIVFLLVLSISFFGCMGLEDLYQNINPIEEIEISLDVHKDGWADFDLKILFKEDALAYDEDAFEEVKNTAEEQGFKIKSYGEGISNGFIASMPVYLLAVQESSDTLEGTLLENMQLDFSEAPLVIEKGFLTTRYKFSSYMSSLMLSEQSFVLSLPGKYIENNADIVEGNKLRWNLSGNRTIEAQSQVVNIGPLILIIFISIAILAVIIFVIFRAGRTTYPTAVYNQKNYCSKCGNKITQGSSFCNKCGAEL